MDRTQDIVMLAEKVLGYKRTYAYESKHHSSYKFDGPEGRRLYVDAEMSHPKPWNPFENPADALMLVDALRARNLMFYCDGNANSFWVMFGEDLMEGKEGVTFCEAVSLAALRVAKTL